MKSKGTPSKKNPCESVDLSKYPFWLVHVANFTFAALTSVDKVNPERTISPTHPACLRGWGIILQCATWMALEGEGARWEDEGRSGLDEWDKKSREECDVEMNLVIVPLYAGRMAPRRCRSVCFVPPGCCCAQTARRRCDITGVHSDSIRVNTTSTRTTNTMITSGLSF